MGNSEVGHLNIGAGRVVYQDVVRIGECHSWVPANGANRDDVRQDDQGW
jgi:hypothetical protein